MGMIYNLRLAVIFLLIGANLPCFSWSSGGKGRSIRNRQKVSQTKKIPLADLIFKAQRAEARGDSKEALRSYEKICKDYKMSDAAPDAYFFRGVFYEKERQFSIAIKMFTKVVKRYPESPWFTQSVERCFQIAKKLQEGTRPRYFGKIPGFRDFDSAIKNYELVVKYAPYSRYAPQALKEIANLQLRAKHYDLAIDAWDRIVDLYPDSVEVPYAYLKIAEIYRNLVKGEEYNQGGAVIARRYYQEFMVIFPQHSEVSFAEKMIRDLEESIVRSEISLGDFYFHSRYNEKAAKESYRLAIDFAPYTLAAGLAQSRIEEINRGKKPKSTPIDFLFPPYKPQSNDEFVAAATVADRIMDQKEGRIDPAHEKSVTPFVKSEDIFVSDEG
ncbi:MAG: tetratricopeptide repeat protein [Puniceicoccales bacterium]|jgi:outer membrane protein assembly factor BamD|nr:tetratricopeptide repeat protein [Puniceicoccales bacterium]